MMTGILERHFSFRHILMTVVILALTSCSKQPPPPPPPAAAPAPVAQPAEDPDAASKQAELSREERIKAIALDKFELYERKIKVADFPRAEAALRDLRSVFDLESEYKTFWDKSIPSSQRIVLTLMSLCETCKDGKCPTCHGAAKCETCKGTGKCGNCDNRPVRTSICRSCICSSCSGTGKCRNCGGFQNKKCAACAGYGTISGTSSIECGRCGGAGSTPGLKGPMAATRIKCLTCNGTGKVAKRILNVCSVCSGKGRLPCTACAGTGRCATCQGAGRNAACPICGGAGQTVHKCPQCDGTGKCIKCDGSGQCIACHGSGKCFECDGGVVRIYDFPVNSKWMTIAEGHILFDSRLNKIVDRSEKPGFREVKYKDLNLSVIVNPGQIVFIATQPAFDAVTNIIRK